MYITSNNFITENNTSNCLLRFYSAVNVMQCYVLLCTHVIYMSTNYCVLSNALQCKHGCTVILYSKINLRTQIRRLSETISKKSAVVIFENNRENNTFFNTSR